MNFHIVFLGARKRTKLTFEWFGSGMSPEMPNNMTLSRRIIWASFATVFHSIVIKKVFI